MKKRSTNLVMILSLSICLMILGFQGVAAAETAFASTRDGNFEIYVINKDGTNQIGLTNNPGFSAEKPSLSEPFDSDGDGVPDPVDNCPATFNPEKIAFESLRDGNYEIYVMNADGTNPLRLTNNPLTDESPTFSPNGSKIVYTSNRAGNWEIYVMNADGTDQVNLTNHPAFEGYASFSPDGSKIVFESYRDGNYEIYVMDADGGNLTRLTNTPASDFSPRFSPDGSKIVYATNGDGNFEIYVMDADGANPVRLTTNTAADYNPIFSPDGSKIAFHSYRDGNYEVYVMDANGANQVNLTNNPAYDSKPSFSPDGSKIAFDSNRDGNIELYVMNVDGSESANLTNNSASDFFAGWGSQADSDDDGIGDACEIIDTTPPVITASVSGTLGDNGWYMSNVEVAWSVVDDESTITSQTGCDLQTVSTDTSGVTFTCTAESDGGSSSQDVTIKRDATAPVLTPTVTPSTVALNGTATAAANASDALSGIASQSCGTVDTSTAGYKSVSCSATDAAGNSASASAYYRVIYAFTGFFPPIDNLPSVNTMAAGSVVPVKFSLGGDQGLNIFAAGYPASSPIDCDAVVPGSTIEPTVSGKDFIYNARIGQYTYSWKTSKDWKGTCRMLIVRLNDGSEYSAKFRFR